MKEVKIFNSKKEADDAVPGGKIKLLIIDGVKLGLARFEGKYFAFDNICPHQNEPLDKGMLTKYGEVVCPLHFYRFNLTSGQETNNRCKAMDRYLIEIRKNGVFIKV